MQDVPLNPGISGVNKECLKHFRKLVSFRVYVILVKTYFLTVLDYCWIIWCHLYPSQMESLQRITRGTLVQKNKFWQIQTLFQSKKELSLSHWCLCSLFLCAPHSRISDRNRASINSNDVVLYTHSTSHFERSIMYIGASLWKGSRTCSLKHLAQSFLTYNLILLKKLSTKCFRLQDRFPLVILAMAFETLRFHSWNSKKFYLFIF